MAKTIKTEFTVDEATELRAAAGEIQYLTNAIHDVFEMLHVSLSMGYISASNGEPGLVAIMELCARAMEHGLR